MLYITSIPDLVSLKDGINKLKITEKDTVAFVVEDGGSTVTMPYQSLSFLLTQVHPQRIEFFAKNSTAEMVSLGALIAKFDKVAVIGTPIALPSDMKNITQLGVAKKKSKPSAPRSSKSVAEPPASKPVSVPAQKTESVPVKKSEPISVQKAESAVKPAKKKSASRKGGTFLDFIGVDLKVMFKLTEDEAASVSEKLENVITSSKDYMMLRDGIRNTLPDYATAIFMKLDTSIEGIKAKLKDYKA